MRFRRCFGGRRKSKLNRDGGNDCVVRATSTFTGIDYDRVYRFWRAINGMEAIIRETPGLTNISEHGVSTNIIGIILCDIFGAKKLRTPKSLTVSQAAWRWRNKKVFIISTWDKIYHAAVLDHGTLLDLADCSCDSDGNPNYVQEAYYLPPNAVCKID